MNLQKLKEDLCPGDLSDDTFSRTEKVHDWRNHVPFWVEKDWSSLSERERILIASIAAAAADDEEWD